MQATQPHHTVYRLAHKLKVMSSPPSTILTALAYQDALLTISKVASPTALVINISLPCRLSFVTAGQCGAGSICVNETSYVASTAQGCIRSTTVLYSTYDSIDYFGYCLPTDTTSAAWQALHATIDRPAVSLHAISQLTVALTCGLSVYVFIVDWYPGMCH